MRKIIETTSTLALWAVWIIGSGLAISDFFFNANISEVMVSHLTLIAWAPALAVMLLGTMLVAVRFTKVETAKKTIANEHTVLWSTEDVELAQTGKVVDLHFAGSGLACQVVTRNEVAIVLHSENQTAHVKVAMDSVQEPAWSLQKIVARSVVVIIAFLPRGF